MPALYAHDRFGARVSERLDNELREIVTKYYTQFSIGLQGPDLFFFYRPYGKNKVTRYGNHLHNVSALPFFRHAVSVVKKRGRNSREYAYLMGFICHFILDSECHPYVEEMIGRTGVQHLEIEEEFEKLLLRMDGRDPFSFPLAELVPTDMLTAETICPFYRCHSVRRRHPEKKTEDNGMTPEIVRTSLKYLKLVKRLFTAPGTVKYSLINAAMKISGKDAYCRGLMHQRRDNPSCLESNQGLLERFDAAIDIAAGMIRSFDESLQTGKPLDKRFDRTFE